MTPEEATIVANIMLTADGGCENCYRSLLAQFSEAFPMFSVEIQRNPKYDQLQRIIEGEEEEPEGYDWSQDFPLPVVAVVRKK